MEKSPVNATLGTRIARRREELGMTQSAAARIANVARSTWIAWEKSDNIPADSNWGIIERVCRWEPGSVRAVRNGGEPVPLAEEPTRGSGALGGEDDPFIRELRAMNLAPRKLEALIEAYRADLAKEEEQRRREDREREEKYRKIAQAI